MVLSMDWSKLARKASPAFFLLASVGMLTLAFAPIGQFYLAYVGLAPWLVLLSFLSSKKAVFLWSWIAGTAFFTANMWWMAYISMPGMLALMVYCGIYWGIAGTIIYAAGLLRPSRAPLILPVLGIATIWTACEWLRGWAITGLPWLYLGHTQTPVLTVCQIADVTGAYGVSFWVVTLNVLVALAWLHRGKISRIAAAASIVALGTGAIVAYGYFRIGQTQALLMPGPSVAVVQPNYPQSNTGEKGATIDERLRFHEEQTLAAANYPGKIDLFVWPETMMWPINKEAREWDKAHDNYGFQIVYDSISRLATMVHAAILTGGDYDADWAIEQRDGKSVDSARDRRNTAYFFDRYGIMDDSIGHRYDKVHLVPWGEYIPGKEVAPWLYRLSMALGPKYYSDYILTPGRRSDLTVFDLQTDTGLWRFVTPICFEDIDAELCAEMFRPTQRNSKRADFLVNITNDGWFKANQNAQHLQAATFRSIENRVWSARSVNTGISGFIDSIGQTSDLLPPRTEGTRVEQIMIDRRLSFFTLHGDLFAELCTAALAGLLVYAIALQVKSRRITTTKANP
jgi:apolipoprotein N-acyltransferase